MDALLLAFFLNLIAVADGRVAGLYRALHRRYDANIQVSCAMASAVIANAAIGGVAGGMLAKMMTPEARSLFFALALAAGGVGLLWRRQRKVYLPDWNVGALLTSFLGLFTLGLGDAGAFMTAGVAAARADPWFAAIGAAVGGMTACIVMLAIRDMISPLALKLFRATAGILLLIYAFISVVAALRLV